MEIKGNNFAGASIAPRKSGATADRIDVGRVDSQHGQVGGRAHARDIRPIDPASKAYSVENFLTDDVEKAIILQQYNGDNSAESTADKPNHALRAYVSQQNLHFEEEQDLISQLLGVDYYA